MLPAWNMVKAKLRWHSSSSIHGGGMRLEYLVPPPMRTLPKVG